MSNLSIYKKNNHYLSAFDSILDLFNDSFEFEPLYQKKANLNWDKEKEQYSVCIEVPGFSKEDIKIENNSKGLVISGEIKNEEIKNKIGERKIHYVYYNNDLDPESIKAELKDGLLHMHIKKSKDKTSKFIEIG